MANLDNNNDNENKKSLSDSLENSVKKSVDSAKKTVEEATELASDAINHPIETAEEFGKQAVKDVTSYSWWAKLILIVFWTILGLFATILLVINLPSTKQWAANQALQIVNRDFKANMSTESVDVDFFGDVTIKGLTIKDYKGLDFITAKEFRANSDWFLLAKGLIQKENSIGFNGLTLKNANVKVITYKGDSISNFIRFTQLFDSGQPSDPNKKPFQLNARVELLNSNVSIINQNSPGEAGKWLYARNFNLRAPKVKINGPDIYAMVNNLTFITNRWGKDHFVDTFSTEIVLNKDFLSLTDLTFNTSHSLLQGNIKFNLNDGSWADFADKVKWDMDLKRGSQISGYDLSYFVTNWDNYNPINISGKMVGPLNKFVLTDFLVRNPKVNISTRSLSIDNILKGNFTIKSSGLSTDFTYKDLREMMPTFVATKMKNFADDFGRLKYNGDVLVTPEMVNVQEGQLITGVGQAKISKFTLSDFSTNMPKYAGYVELKDFNTSAVTKNKTVGLISGKFNLQGQSFDVNTMRINTKSQITRLEVMDKIITNITLDGLLDHKKYNGLVVVNDPNARANVRGLIDFSSARLKADVLANIQHLNINYFTGQKGNQMVSGSIDGKLTMTTINDLVLYADASDIKFSSGGKTYAIPFAKVNTYIENGNRFISVQAPGAIDGMITGKYNLGDLAGMVENGLGKILVGPEPRKLYNGQNFQMTFNVQQDLANYFLPDLKIPYGAQVSGEYDGNSNNLILNADAAALKYIMTKVEEISEADQLLAQSNPEYQINTRGNVTRDSAMVDNLMLRINTANLDQQILATIDRVQYNQNVLKDVLVSGRNSNNKVLHLAANFMYGSPADELNNQMKAYAINLNQSSNQFGDYIIRFEPTELNFNEVRWAIDTSENLDHSITYRKKTKDFEAKNIRIYSDESELMVNNAIFKSGKDFQIDANIRNFDIEKIFLMQSGGNSMGIKGLANGSVKITMNENNLAPIVDLNVTNIKMNNSDMGDIIVKAESSDRPNVFNVDAKVMATDTFSNNNLHLIGTIDNNTKSPTLDLVAELREFNIAFAQQFVKDIFGNLRGRATGDLRISGKLSDIDYSGDIGLKGFGLKLLFTGVDYSFDDTVIPLSKGLAILNDIGVSDGRTNSKGRIGGAIQFETLASMGVNLVMSAENLLMLNTTQKDFDLFWGRIYGQGDLYVSGLVSSLTIATPNMRALSNSTFTFNSASASNTEEFKMLRFLTEDQAGNIALEDKKRSGANMEIDFRLNVDKGTSVNVLIGDDIGNLTVKGDSDLLHFRMNRTGAIAMNGKYTVDTGTFLSPIFLNKSFQIAKGSSIEWDGDAMTPRLDITANYRRLVSNGGEYLNMGKLSQPLDILLEAEIKGTLDKPEIDPKITALDVSSQIKETLANKFLDENEKNMQFSSILVLNQFNVSETGGLAVDVESLAMTTGVNAGLKSIGSAINSMTNKFQLDLGYVGATEGSNTADRANAGLNFALSPRVTVKGGLGIPVSKTDIAETNTGVSGEGSLEWDISKKNDGSLIIRGYSKPSTVGLVGGVGSNGSENQTYGAGVAWSKSFNTLFGKKNKKKRNNKSISKSSDSILVDSVKSLR